MLRPCFLVVDREHTASISTRKLVIETAKMNVITAYSGEEAVHAFRRFPNVDGIVMDAGVPDVPCSELIVRLKEVRSDVPIVVIGNPHSHPCAGATHRMEGFSPQKVLGLLQKLHPEETKAITWHEAEVQQEEHDAVITGLNRKRLQ